MASSSAQNTATGPSTTVSSAVPSTGPSTTPSRTSPRVPQRRKVNKDWNKDDKTKTCKCKICGERVTKSSLQCAACKIRICSDCSEPDGTQTDKHKAVARDYIDNGCWCGFPTKFNPAFKDIMPSPKQAAEASKPTPSTSKKTKKKQSTPSASKKKQPTQAFKQEDPFTSPDASASANAGPSAPAPDGASESPSDPFAVPPSAQAPSSSYSFVRQKRKASEPEQKQEVAEPAQSSSEIEAQQPARKRQKTNSSSSLTEFESASNENNAQSAPEQRSSDNIVSSDLPSIPSKQKTPAATRRTSTRTTGTAGGSSFKDILSAGLQSAPSKTRAAPPKPVNSSVVIIGAGVIGMFTALRLAQKASSAGKQQTITIVDINSSPFALASGNCAGFLTTHGFRVSHEALIADAIGEWNELTDSRDFRETVKLNSQVFVTTDDEEAEREKLSWVRCGDDKFTAVDDGSLGVISPSRLAKWLYQQCEAHGVQFRFDSHPVEVKKRCGSTTGVAIQPVNGAKGKAKAEVLACSDLVFAAGAFTPDLVDKLFPSGGVKHMGSAHVAAWVRYEGLDITACRSQGVMTAVEPGCGLEGHISIIAKPSRHTMVVSGSHPASSSRRLGPYDALSTPLRDPAALQQLAGKHIVAEGVDLTDKRALAGEDACYISSKPVMGQVEGVPAGVKVWACHGFGMHGTTLGPGVGKVMAEMVMGEIPSVDLAEMGVSGGVVGGVVARPSKGRGKGKGKAAR